MKISPTQLKDVILLGPDVHRDPRGLFLETYQSQKYKAAGMEADFIQDNYARSKQGVLRGLHAQLKKPQAKLIRVTQGEVFDVAVDVRPDSPTFGKWEGFRLSNENFFQLFIPEGFLHGYCVLSPEAVVEYKCTDYYNPGDEIGVRWDDPELKIQWPLPKPLLSDKDSQLPFFRDLRAQFDHFRSK